MSSGKRGYEGASLSNLTRAMGISRPSLYAAFGDKEALFCKILDRYLEGPAGFVRAALSQPTAQAVIKNLLEGAANQATHPASPRGCLLLQAGLACGKGSAPIRQELVRRRESAEQAVRARLEKANGEGDLRGDTDPADLARYVVTIMRGIGVQAADGASREDLQRVIEVALGICQSEDIAGQ